MKNTRKISNDLYYVGASDRRIALFENIFPIPNGVSYNSYLLDDEKTVLFDTVDKAVSDKFFDNIAEVLGDKTLDYVIINHMEPDHCAALETLVLRYENIKIVGNAKTLGMIKQFFDFDIDSRFVLVKEGDTLETGHHTLSFYMAAMVHWPEVMVTYDSADKILFSADAFGTFGAINGNLFADEVNFEAEHLNEARRYYTNIVGKYGMQVQSLLKKADGLEINTICPLHGVIWRENIAWYIEKYKKWSTWTAETDGVMIAYASIYGNTEKAADILAGNLADNGIKNIAMYDVSVTDISYIVSDCFKYDKLVFACPTYNGDLFPNMERLLLDLKAHNLQNKTIALIENGSWGAVAGKKMAEIISSMKNMTILPEIVSIKSSVKAEQKDGLAEMAKAITEK
ncbi:MAG: FprA family A-type flavoprotein [Oscillospiraceae bacterium]